MNKIFIYIIISVGIGSIFCLPNTKRVRKTSYFSLRAKKKTPPHKTAYSIDVVIPAINKDLPTLEHCIAGIKKNGQSIQNVYVISEKKLTENAIWIPETTFPFSKVSIAHAIFNDDHLAKTYIERPNNRLGWIMQQLFKLYSPLVIQNISPNILLLDSDTMFLSATAFMNDSEEPFYNPGSVFHEPYFIHAQKLVPTIKRDFAHSGITHHMLIQKRIMSDLFDSVEKSHNMPFWKAFCACIDTHYLLEHPSASVCSEYEIYFNFVRSHQIKSHIRKLKWLDVDNLDLNKYKKEGYNYVSCHEHMRNKATV